MKEPPETIDLEKFYQDRARAQLDTFLSDCHVTAPNGKTLLEIGFKRGHFTRAARDAGFDITATEIKANFYDQLRTEAPDLKLILYDGLKVPLSDACFDYIVSYQVLEHVTCLETTIEECIRLLKPGGVMYHICPNYHSFYEGHIKIPWLPFLTRNTGRIYLKCLRRYDPLYEGLMIVKPSILRKIFAQHASTMALQSLGRAEFKRKFTQEQIRKVDQPLIRAVLLGMLKVPLLKYLFIGCIAALDVYYPITLIAQKKEA